MDWFDSAKELVSKWKQREAAARDKFTPRAIQALALARKEADRLNHNFVGTEHVLLGLVKLGQGGACNALKDSGLNLEVVRTQVEKMTGVWPTMQESFLIPYTPRVKKILERAKKQAMQLNHTYIGTGHLLLGLMSENEGPAAQIFKRFNVDLEQTREKVLTEMKSKLLPGNDQQEGLR